MRIRKRAFLFLAVLFICASYLLIARRLIDSSLGFENRAVSPDSFKDSMQSESQDLQTTKDSPEVPPPVVSQAEHLRENQDVEAVVTLSYNFKSHTESSTTASASARKERGELQRPRLLLPLVRIRGGQRRMEPLESSHPPPLDGGGEPSIPAETAPAAGRHRRPVLPVSGPLLLHRSCGD